MVPSSTIDKLCVAPYSAYAMIAGMELDIFTHLASGPMSATLVAQALGVEARRIAPLLYALVAAGLLALDGDAFRNVPESDEYLVRGKANYLGDRRRLWADLFRAALETAGSIRESRPLAKHDFSEMSDRDLLDMFAGLHPRAVRVGRELAPMLRTFGGRRVLDLGGGSGGAAIAIVEALPDSTATVLDLPPVLRVAATYRERSIARDRVSLLAHDIFAGPIPGAYDAVVMQMLLQVFDPERAQHVLRAAYDALDPGGHVFVISDMLEDSRVEPHHVAVFNIVFLDIYEHGQAYTDAEHREWLSRAGFIDCRRLNLAGNGAIVARKPLES